MIISDWEKERKKKIYTKNSLYKVIKLPYELQVELGQKLAIVALMEVLNI